MVDDMTSKERITGANTPAKSLSSSHPLVEKPGELASQQDEAEHSLGNPCLALGAQHGGLRRVGDCVSA